MRKRLAAVAVLIAALVVASTAAAVSASSKQPMVATKHVPRHVVKKVVKKKVVKKKVVAKPVAAKPQTTAVTGTGFEMGFKLSQTTVPSGTVVFTITNTGVLPHDFSFGSAGGGTPMLEPGQSATLTVKFPKPGKYTYICTVEGHQESGMIGSLTVT